MPHHPSEEDAPSNIYDKVARESKDAQTSDHPMHDENKEPVKNVGDEHKSKGPQISENMPEAEDKDTLKAKAQELNK